MPYFFASSLAMEPEKIIAMVLLASKMSKSEASAAITSSAERLPANLSF
ncbi:MAG: hypothetical protein K9G65_05640 [Rickettsiaceae bacterium]|nr:hypothetical protein [Rickettsiaceae bacterium]